MSHHTARISIKYQKFAKLPVFEYNCYDAYTVFLDGDVAIRCVDSSRKGYWERWSAEIWFTLEQEQVSKEFCNLLLVQLVAGLGCGMCVVRRPLSFGVL